MRLHNWAFGDPSMFERVFANLIDQQIPRRGARGRDQDPPDRRPAARGVVAVRRTPQRVELEQTGLSQTGGETHFEYRVLR
jgi:hypothetical protein